MPFVQPAARAAPLPEVRAAAGLEPERARHVVPPQHREQALPPPLALGPRVGDLEPRDARPRERLQHDRRPLAGGPRRDRPRPPLDRAAGGAGAPPRARGGRRGPRGGRTLAARVVGRRPAQVEDLEDLLAALEDAVVAADSPPCSSVSSSLSIIAASADKGFITAVTTDGDGLTGPEGGADCCVIPRGGAIFTLSSVFGIAAGTVGDPGLWKAPPPQLPPPQHSFSDGVWRGVCEPCRGRRAMEKSFFG